MADQHFVDDDIPERFVEVDAARLLLLLTTFMKPIESRLLELQPPLPEPCVGHVTPEYLVQKLDFLLRYPRYFAYELIELHRMHVPSALDGERVKDRVRQILADREPELHTLAYRKFWRGAYERLDDVEAWWASRKLAFRRFERRGNAPPQKHYFVTELGRNEATRLTTEVPHARWYSERLSQLHHYFGELSASDIKALQYAHPGYRQAQLNDLIPDLEARELNQAFRTVFDDELGDLDG